ncbi:response regulator transcription factor [Methylomonas koyamae]|uniref:response regulator transcription factor n=1 Tax=Methylomonas koyamae TaxID=702114 RepID=UPI0006D087AB|nr:response regulator transcription factor [Methylomonas koyamae]
MAFYIDEIRALNAAEQDKPGLILLNYALRGADTAEYTGLLLNASPASNIVIIGDDLATEQVVNCIMAGAKGYQNSGSLAVYINRMIRAVAAGEAWLSRKLVASLLDAIHKNYAGQDAL